MLHNSTKFINFNQIWKHNLEHLNAVDAGITSLVVFFLILFLLFWHKLELSGHKKPCKKICMAS